MFNILYITTRQQHIKRLLESTRETKYILFVVYSRVTTIGKYSAEEFTIINILIYFVFVSKYNEILLPDIPHLNISNTFRYAIMRSIG